MRVTKIIIMLFIPATMLLAGCKLIEVGRVDFAAVTADVRKAHVIDQHDNDVGPRRRIYRGNARIGRRENAEQSGEKCQFHVAPLCYL